MEMTLLCWNVAGRVRRLPEQVACAVEHGADLLCLQETTVATAAVWTRSLVDAGWTYAMLAEPKPALAAGRTRSLIALTAARAPLESVRVARIPWPERPSSR